MAPAKGIITRAADFAPFGIRSKLIGLIWYTIKERRLTELLVSLLYVVQFVISTKSSFSRETDLKEYEEVYQRYVLADGGRLIARRNSIFTHGDVLIAAEYGQPGARIIYRTTDKDVLFSPYEGDRGVWHIHAILPQADGLFLVATGDSKKYLDLLEIGSAGCRIGKRIEHFCAGYAGMVRHNDAVWVGSDFSERANFIKKVGEKGKYFLPRICVGNYVVQIDSLDESHIIVVTRKLNSFTGYALVFDTIERAFVAGNPIAVSEWTLL